MKKKNIVILGSTGSIGHSALAVARQFPEKLRVLGLAACSRIDVLAQQMRAFKPAYVAIADESKAEALRAHAPRGTKVLVGSDGVNALASLKEADVVLMAIVGGAAIHPLLSAIRAGKTIALANKESVVIGGSLVMAAVRKYGARLVPVDSEQSAIFQCLEGHGLRQVRQVYLTASGGPLVDSSSKELSRVSVKKVLAHPRWKMGAKITVDSATLMNKGLEVIEAQQLFGLRLDQIKVVIHRQALVHSMVEFVDGSLLAQVGVTDMKLPIQYAVSCPERWSGDRLRLDPLATGPWTFEAPDRRRFPCLGLAYEAARRGGTAPCALNAANEVAVAAFLDGRLAFVNIPRVIAGTLARTPRLGRVTLDDIFDADAAARDVARRLVFRLGKRGLGR
jgi:1-deoxy-D-xylulose-5-phosphate reductoisomerase